jgi:hypothetical protein
MLATKGPVTIITIVQRGMSRGVEVLVERLLAAKGPVVIITLQCTLATEVSIARLRVLDHLAQWLLQRCRPSWDIREHTTDRCWIDLPRL